MGFSYDDFVLGSKIFLFFTGSFLQVLDSMCHITGTKNTMNERRLDGE